MARGQEESMVARYPGISDHGLIGDLQTAALTFEKMHTYANHLGLYSEEIGSTGEQLGNFPQAFSHLALISAVINLDYLLDHGAGTTGPVLSRAR
jgi:GH15 family glucan-1,4-alpha-glucosidase